MPIEELKDKHFQISDEFDRCSQKHTKLSIQFAIEVLEDVAAYYAFGALPTVFIDDKIQELKQHLDGKEI